MALHCGKNTINAAGPVHGFGVGPTAANAKQAAMGMAHGFANAVAAARAAGMKCPALECPKLAGPIVANEKTTELVSVKLKPQLYLSVVRRQFDVVIFCQ